MSNSINQAFKGLQLSKAETPSEHENVFEVSYEYLSKIKNFNDVKAFQNCLVALINLDKYNKAYELVQKIPSDAITAEMVLEVAYVLYKVGKSDELLALVKKHQDATTSGYYLFGIKNILAQNYYKIGKYEESLQLVQECIRDSGNANIDLAVNERAVISQINLQEAQLVNTASTVVDKEGEQNYDLLFNESLVEFSKNNKEKALQLLKQAESLCLEQNMGVDKEDLLSELLPIRLNISYIKQSQGDLAGAIADLSEEMKNINYVNDDILKLILKLNFYSCKQQQAGGKLDESNLVFRDLQLQEVLNKMNQKLTKFQYHVLMKNNLLVKYLEGTLGSTLTSESFIQKYMESFPGDLTPLVYSLLSKYEVTADDLKNESKSNLTRRKVYIPQRNAEGNQKLALMILQDFLLKGPYVFDTSLLSRLDKRIIADLEKDQLVPSVVGLYLNIKKQHVCALYRNERDIILGKLKDKIVNSSPEALITDRNLFILYKEIGYMLYPGLDGKQILEALARADPEDKFLSAITSGDISHLTSIEQLQTNETVEELIDEGTKYYNSIDPENKYKAVSITKKRTRKRQPKFSASKVIKAEEDLNLDPERWLPKKLRSYYKPSKKDRLKTSHQGAIERLSTPHESSPAPAGASSGKNTTNTSSSNSKNKKKKKKGKK